MTYANLIPAGTSLEGFEHDELLTAPRRGALEAQLEQLKERLLEPLLKSVQNMALIQDLRWVANEATALAWFTVCPILVLPTLFEEKVQSALRRWARQESLLKRETRGHESRASGPA